jgi:hypothetical protein
MLDAVNQLGVGLTHTIERKSHQGISLFPSLTETGTPDEGNAK